MLAHWNTKLSPIAVTDAYILNRSHTIQGDPKSASQLFFIKKILNIGDIFAKYEYIQNILFDCV